MTKLIWEKLENAVDGSQQHMTSRRARVPGGWLYQVAAGVTFVPSNSDSISALEAALESSIKSQSSAASPLVGVTIIAELASPTEAPLKIGALVRIKLPNNCGVDGSMSVMRELLSKACRALLDPSENKRADIFDELNKFLGPGGT